MVDEEILADGCTGVDVDARVLMRIFGHHARQKRNFQFKEPMCKAINTDGFKSRVCKLDFLLRTRCRVAQVCRTHIGLQDCRDLGQTFHKRTNDTGDVFVILQQICAKFAQQDGCLLQVVAHHSVQEGRVVAALCVNFRIHGRAGQLDKAHHAALETACPHHIRIFIVFIDLQKTRCHRIDVIPQPVIDHKIPLPLVKLKHGRGKIAHPRVG